MTGRLESIGPRPGPRVDRLHIIKGTIEHWPFGAVTPFYRAPPPGLGWYSETRWSCHRYSSEIICLRTTAPRSTRHTIAIAIEVAVPLPEQLLGVGKGADLRASVGMAAWTG